MKKGLKITGIIIGSMLVLIIAAGLLLPVLFKEKIKEQVETAISGMVDAKVTFAGYRLSLFRAFPNATFTLNELNVTGIDQFEGDTLASIKSAGLVFNLMSLFGDQGYEIKSMFIDKPMVHAIVLKDGSVNWDIMKESTEEEGMADLVETPMKLTFNKFTLRDGLVYYTDKEADMSAIVDGLNANISGRMTGMRTNLDLDLTASAVDFVYDKIPYLSDASVIFKAGVNAELDSMRFVIKSNLLKINDISMDLSGLVAMPEDDIEFDLVFLSRETSFKSLLSLVPAFYMKDFDGLKTDGTSVIDGAIKGIYSSADSTIPDIIVNLAVENGMISYPGLPEKITAINLQVGVAMDGRDMDKTTVDVSRFHFVLAGSPFDMTLKLATPLSDPSVAMSASGKIDLAKLLQAVPIDSVSLEGVIDISLKLAGRMSMIENEQYDQFNASGDLILSDMAVAMTDLPPVKISRAALKFSPAYAELTNMSATMGEKSNFSLAGRLENYIPYMFSDGTLKGKLSLKSKSIDLNEILDIIMSDTITDADTTVMEVIQIPENIDFTFDASVESLTYGRLAASDVRGNVVVRNRVVTMSETGMKALGGSMLINATYDTRDTLKPMVDAEMFITSVDIKETFNAFNTVRQLMPAASGLGGDVSVKFSFKSLLGSNMMPVISTLSGMGEASSQSIQILDSKAFDIIQNILKMNKGYTNIIKDLKATFIINDGRLFVKPFDTRIGNIKINLSGDQGLDRTINYLIKTEIPRAELGSAAGALMSMLSSQVTALGLSLTPPETIMLNLQVGGTVTDPVIKPLFAGGTGSAGGTVSSTISTATEAVKEEVSEKVNEAVRQQADKILKETEEKAQMLRDEAAAAAKRIREESDLRGQKLIKDAEAKGPIAVVAAKKAAEAMNKEAEKRATQLVSEAGVTADKMIADARAKADELLK